MKPALLAGFTVGTSNRKVWIRRVVTSEGLILLRFKIERSLPKALYAGRTNNRFPAQPRFAQDDSTLVRPGVSPDADASRTWRFL